MSNHRLSPLTVPVPLRLERVENASHLFLLFFCQFYIPRREVLFEALRFRRSWDGNHVLCQHPCESDLSQCTSFPLRDFLDRLDDFLVVVEVLALEFGDYSGNISLTTRRGRKGGVRCLPVRRKSSGAKSSGLW